ncbi:hypothetical protein M758_1G077600 [Ceratodon purpureus]|nr:hypothetical protein M758_1G077600 [Ceratodon purpureus]
MWPAKVKRALKDRWLGLCLGMWMQACGGISYAFSLYSGDLKHTLGYNQEMIDGLGTAKDIGGNVGIISGLLIDLTSAWFVLLVGGLLHFCFYFLLFLAATGRITPSYWQMCGIIMVGTNGATWFNTAVLVTCMRNFPSDRGVVVGLLKGFIGLSGAIFTQVYTAVYAPYTGPFLLLCAIVPPLVAMLSMVVIRPVEAPRRKDESDKSKFSFLYIVGVALAFYLMAVILIQDSFMISKTMSRLFMTVMLIILFLPILIPLSAGTQYKGYSALPTEAAIINSPGPDRVVPKQLFSERKSQHKGTASIDVPPRTTDRFLDASKPRSLDTPSKTTVKLGHDHNLLQATSTQDYWLLFFAMGCGTGSGLTAINNLAQMAESLGSRSIGAFVALVSVWNFLGRMGSGYISEYYMKQYATPRPVFLFCVQAVMACAHLLFASSVPTMLYLASILVGLAHGAHWTLMVATSSELFGLKNFGALYNTLSISATVGSYLLSVKLAGYIYDQQVASLQAAAVAAGQVLTGPQKCVGPQCFRSTFLVMACVCGLGCLALTRLISRTRKVYRDMYKVQQAKDILAKGNSSEHSPLLSPNESQEADAPIDSPVLKSSGLSDAQRHRHAVPSRPDSE